MIPSEACGDFNTEGGALDLPDGSRLSIPRMALNAARTRICISRGTAPIRGALADAVTVRMQRVMTTNVLKLEVPLSPELFMGRPLRLGYLRFEDKGLRVWGLAPEPGPNTGSDPTAGILRGQVIQDSLQEDLIPDGGARPELPWKAVLAPIMRCDNATPPPCDCRGGICQ